MAETRTHRTARKWRAVLAYAVAGLSLTARAADLKFMAAGKEFRFDTGALHGTLRGAGKSTGLSVAFDSASGTNLAKSMGLFSHYRLLDAETRYGTAAWDWVSRAQLMPDGAVEVFWTTDADHPFDLMATYRWAASNALDVTTTVTAKRELRDFEVFLASYFNGFPQARVFALRDGKPEFVSAERSHGTWQAFPRDDEAARIIGDGRWKRPPHPVEWNIMPHFAAPLGLRHDATTGLTALVMAHPQDCFGVLTPHGEEGHRSLYLSLFGRDFKSGETASAVSRLVIGRGISGAQAVAIFEAFVQGRSGADGRIR